MNQDTTFKDCNGVPILFDSKIYFVQDGIKGTIFRSKREENKGAPIIRWSDGLFDTLEQYHMSVRVYFE